MKIKGELELEISQEEARRITLSFLQSKLPYEAEIRYDGLKQYWFYRTYDARGDKVIGYTKGREVWDGDLEIQKVIDILTSKK